MVLMRSFTKQLKKMGDLTLVQKFSIISFFLLLISSAVIGYWVSNQIESRVVVRIGHTSTLFAGSVIAPTVRAMIADDISSEKSDKELMAILDNTSLGQEIVALKIWDNDGRILSSTNSEEVGKVFEMEAGLDKAWSGIVSVELSNLDREEHEVQRQDAIKLLETYSPIREPGTGKILAVVEFYQSVLDIKEEVWDARIKSWIIVCAVVMAIYFSLVFLVRTGSKTIMNQRDELNKQVQKYRILLDRNSELNQRVRASAVRTTALNERYLRKIAAELHDGPAQDIGYSLLIIDRDDSHLIESNRKNNDRKPYLKNALKRSLKDIRNISAGLKSPELESLTIKEVVSRAVRIQEIRSGGRANVLTKNLPLQASLAVKITIFRIIQEALTNAHKHAGDLSPTVRVAARDESIDLEITDSGPGFIQDASKDDGLHLGISVMKERVELLGGEFELIGISDLGTSVKARLPFGKDGGLQ